MLVSETKFENESSEVGEWRPFRLVSLLDMLKKYAKGFFEISSDLAKLHAAMAIVEKDDYVGDLAKNGGLYIPTILDKIRLSCSEMNLIFSMNKIDRILKQYEGLKALGQSMPEDEFGAMACNKLKPVIQELTERIEDELNTKYLFYVSEQARRYYEENQFDDLAIAIFDKSNFDMIEAGKCFALSQYPACVFHLMRILDAGLKLLGEQLGIQVKNHNWDEYKRELKGRAVAMRATNPEKAQTIFDIIEHYDAIAGIRNPLMHSDELLPIDSIHRIEKKYTPDEAFRQFDNVKVFMASLAIFLQKESSSPAS
jgi:hypothetical protein